MLLEFYGNWTNLDVATTEAAKGIRSSGYFLWFSRKTCEHNINLSPTFIWTSLRSMLLAIRSADQGYVSVSESWIFTQSKPLGRRNGPVYWLWHDLVYRSLDPQYLMTKASAIFLTYFLHICYRYSHHLAHPIFRTTSTFFLSNSQVASFQSTFRYSNHCFK